MPYTKTKNSLQLINTVFFIFTAAYLTVWPDKSLKFICLCSVSSSRSKDRDTKCLLEFKQMEGLYWEELLKSFLPKKNRPHKPFILIFHLKSLLSFRYRIIPAVRGNCFQSSFTSKWVKICSRYYLTSIKS